MDRRIQRPLAPGWRRRMYDTIFETDTFAGRAFDVVLLITILASVFVVSMETVQDVRREYGPTLVVAEWCFTVIFTIEYLLRLVSVRRPLRYALSFWGIVDLLAFLPTYLMVLVAPFRSFFILRAIRLLRVFRVLKLIRLSSEAEVLGNAVWRSREKIVVFLAVVLVAVTVSATLMYHVELYGQTPERPSQFTSIPNAMYWAIVTMTTVGYGDVVPMTTAGKMISAVLILLGYSLIIVPTGFITVAAARSEGALGPPTGAKPGPPTGAKPGAVTDAEPTAVMNGATVCPACGHVGHPPAARYCYRCGQLL